MGGKMSGTKTYIWRMTHYRNIAFILQNGLHCCNCGVQDPNYTNIGYKSLIENRGQSPVISSPAGVLNDYVPFYFHYKMPMLHNIFKGRVKEYKGMQEEIIYLVSTAERIDELGLSFVFTDRHAYLSHKTEFSKLEDLKNLDMKTIKDDTWHKQYTELRKEIKQAEFLVHQHVPADAIVGIIANNDEIATFVTEQVNLTGFALKVVIKPEYYYS